jgi:hypothetical protein
MTKRRENQRFDYHLCPRRQSTDVAGVNQPTKKLTKGGACTSARHRPLLGLIISADETHCGKR